MKIVSLFVTVTSVLGATKTYDWTVSWKTVNPDGLKERQVVAINNEWPLPVLRGHKGDRIIINSFNDLTNPERNSSIHFHGIFQNGTNDMDGPTWVTQCPHVPGTTFVYNFTLDQDGTYWYHTHVTDLYPDGYRQMLLIDNDKPWFEDAVADEISFTMSDWYHELTEVISETSFLTPQNSKGVDPVPNSLLLNDTLAETIKYEVEPNKTYRLRILNTGALTGYYFYIPEHNFTIVEADGVYTEPAEATTIYIAAAQRYSILFNTTSDEDAVYKLVQIADSSLYASVPPDLQLNHTMYLYTGNKSKDGNRYKPVDHEDIYRSGIVDTTQTSLKEYTSRDIKYFDDFNLVPYDHMPLLPGPDVDYTMTVRAGILDDKKPYAFFNNITWTQPQVPSLYTLIDAPDDDTASNATIYGEYTHPIVLNHMDTVQLVVNNDGGRHPFHLHGHNFQAILRGNEFTSDTATPYNPESTENQPFPEYPMRRDTFVLFPYSHFVLRWRADNPGVWFFHCHIDWHLTQGLALEFIEAPVQIRQNYRVHPLMRANVDMCGLSGLPSTGNAASNNENFFDLSGQNTPPSGAIPY